MAAALAAGCGSSHRATVTVTTQLQALASDRVPATPPPASAVRGARGTAPAAAGPQPGCQVTGTVAENTSTLARYLGDRHARARAVPAVRAVLQALAARPVDVPVLTCPPQPAVHLKNVPPPLGTLAGPQDPRCSSAVAVLYTLATAPRSTVRPPARAAFRAITGQPPSGRAEADGCPA